MYLQPDRTIFLFAIMCKSEPLIPPFGCFFDLQASQKKISYLLILDFRVFRWHQAKYLKMLDRH